jgi:hypothetical protein
LPTAIPAVTGKSAVYIQMVSCPVRLTSTLAHIVGFVTLQTLEGSYIVPGKKLPYKEALYDKKYQDF